MMLSSFDCPGKSIKKLDALSGATENEALARTRLDAVLFDTLLQITADLERPIKWTLEARIRLRKLVRRKKRSLHGIMDCCLWHTNPRSMECFLLVVGAKKLLCVVRETTVAGLYGYVFVTCCLLC